MRWDGVRPITGKLKVVGLGVIGGQGVVRRESKYGIRINGEGLMSKRKMMYLLATEQALHTKAESSSVFITMGRKGWKSRVTVLYQWLYGDQH